jgi:uncharacterized protein (DUF58 family)
MGAAFSHKYLDLSRMEVLRRVRLVPRGAAEGTFAGPHESHVRGTAVEFADYREYSEGDDIRLLDWKVFARSDKYYVRLYEAERNLLSYLVVDTSASMEFAGAARPTSMGNHIAAALRFGAHQAPRRGRPRVAAGVGEGPPPPLTKRDEEPSNPCSGSESKLDHACRLAAALAYLVVREGDEVGLSLADERVHAHLPTRSGWTHLAAAVDLLGKSSPRGRTDLAACLMEVYRRVTRRGVLIVLSDLLDSGPEFWKRIDLFRQSKFDVILFHVVHPEEIELPDVPLARFRDPEGSGSFQTEPEVVRTLYRRRFAEFLATCAAGAKTRGCDWYLARTDVDPYLFLKSCFLARGAGR